MEETTVSSSTLGKLMATKSGVKFPSLGAARRQDWLHQLGLLQLPQEHPAQEALLKPTRPVVGGTFFSGCYYYYVSNHD